MFLLAISSARSRALDIERARLRSVWTEQINRNMLPFRAGITRQHVDDSARLGDYRVVIKDNALYVGPGKAKRVAAKELDHAVP